MKEKLNQMSDTKLVDVVKNYERYGYDEITKNDALEILKTRGFDLKDLEIMGQEKTADFEAGKGHLKQFNRNSWIAFVLYLVAVSISIFLGINQIDPLTATIIKLCCYAVYILFMALSIVNLKNYYEIARSDDYSTDIMIYVIAGMPLYILAFFYIRSKMKEHLDRI